MGRDAYLTLLTLGRHCYEPQSRERSSPNISSEDQEHNNGDPSAQPILDGTPASQTQNTPPSNPSNPSNPYLDTQRALKRAQNDVVTTVGYEINKKGRSSRRSTKSDEEERENDVGLFLGAVDIASTYFVTWPLIGIRNELQSLADLARRKTFKGLENLSYIEILHVALLERSALDWFAGIPAHVIFQLVNLYREYGQSLLFKWLRNKPPFVNPKTGKPRRLLLNICYKSLTLVAWFWAYPFFQHSVLQNLHLIPPTPFFPSVSAFYLPTNMMWPTSFKDVTDLISKSASFTESYLFWALIQQKIAFRVHVTFLNFFSKFLPRPDKHVPLTGGGFVSADGNFDDFFSEDESDATQTSLTGTTRATANTDRNDPNDTDTGEDGLTQTFTATVQLELPSEHEQPSPTDAQRTSEMDFLEPDTSHSNGISATISEIEVQVTTTSSRNYTNNDTHHRSSRFGNGSSSTSRSARDGTYRTSTLASHPANVISAYAAEALASVFTLGFESMVTRSIARAFVAQNLSRPLPAANIVSIASRRGLIDASVGTDFMRVLSLRYGVYRMNESGRGWPLVMKGIALEWGIAWGFFEAAYWMATYVGTTWFGYR